MTTSPHAPADLTIRVTAADRRRELEADVRAGLTSTPRELPAKWLYDERGGELFGRITQLEEYYLTRAEAQILDAVAAQLPACAPARTIVELGAGDSPKTRAMVAGCVARGTIERFVAFDIDAESLRRSTAELARAFPTVRIEGAVADMMRDLDLVPDEPDVLVALLGSTIGNFLPHQRHAFYGELGERLRTGSWLLLGYDLVKDPATIVAAYDDPPGVTASFTGNVLRMLDRELDADFDETAFRHDASWDADGEFVRVGLRAERDQRVRIAALDLEVSFAAGELLHLEVCCKFRREGVTAELDAAGFAVTQWWTDDQQRFALCLAQRR
jgi:L-histidine Nalpha-methyltransferase